VKKIKAITALKVIQGHRGRHQSKAHMRLPMVISNLVPFPSYRSLLFKFCILRFRAILWGLRGNVRCLSWAHWKARSGLPISVNWTSFAGVTAESPRAKRYRKSLQRSNSDRKFQV